MLLGVVFQGYRFAQPLLLSLTLRGQSPAVFADLLGLRLRLEF